MPLSSTGACNTRSEVEPEAVRSGANKGLVSNSYFVEIRSLPLPCACVRVFLYGGSWSHVVHDLERDLSVSCRRPLSRSVFSSPATFPPADGFTAVPGANGACSLLAVGTSAKVIVHWVVVRFQLQGLSVC